MLKEKQSTKREDKAHLMAGCKRSLGPQGEGDSRANDSVTRLRYESKGIGRGQIIKDSPDQIKELEFYAHRRNN